MSSDRSNPAGGPAEAPGDRLAQLRALVERLERLPASTQRDWMLQEARSRMVDVETGDDPRPMRRLDAEPPPPPEPPRPRSKPARPRPVPPTVSAPPAPEPAPPRVAETGRGSDTFETDEVLWLDEPDDDSTELPPWRRGLRG